MNPIENQLATLTLATPQGERTIQASGDSLSVSGYVGGFLRFHPERNAAAIEVDPRVGECDPGVTRLIKDFLNQRPLPLAMALAHGMFWRLAVAVSLAIFLCGDAFTESAGKFAHVSTAGLHRAYSQGESEAVQETLCRRYKLGKYMMANLAVPCEGGCGRKVAPDLPKRTFGPPPSLYTMICCRAQLCYECHRICRLHGSQIRCPGCSSEYLSGSLLSQNPEGAQNMLRKFVDTNKERLHHVLDTHLSLMATVRKQTAWAFLGQMTD